MRAIVPNVAYFKPIILKFKTFIYNSKIPYDFCVCGGNTLEMEAFFLGEKFFNIGIFRKNASK